MLTFVVILVMSVGFVASEEPIFALICDIDEVSLHRSACLPANYSKLELPRSTGDPPILVNVTLAINDILEVDESDFSVRMSMFLGATWKEPRIRKNPAALEKYL